MRLELLRMFTGRQYSKLYFQFLLGSELSLPVMSDSISPQKDNAEHEEDPKDLVPDHLPLPDEIADLSAAEQAKLNRLVTRRLDLTLLPVVFILFLLNIL